MGLMALLARMGRKVAPFKVGPDYIDPAFHELACGTDSFNIDSYMLDEAVLKHLFHKHLTGKDVAVVEGVMGLFDGLGDDAIGSTAEVARMLELPVILVVNAHGLYQSVAAMVAGFARFDPKIHITGVILNNVGSAEQYAFLKQYIEEKTGVACVGYLPNNPAISLESRHLGLVQAVEVTDFDTRVATLRECLSQTIDVARLLNLTELTHVTHGDNQVVAPWHRPLKGLKIGLAHDAAFRFYYQDNIVLLQESGAEIVRFSPLKDTQIPTGVDALYIGGGYPEVFAPELSANIAMRESVKNAAGEGLPVYAECGGLMYLCSAIRSVEGESHPMCDIFGCTAQMTTLLQRFGYCQLTWDDASTRTHEFHRSKLVFDADAKAFEMSFYLRKPLDDKHWCCGLTYQNVLAGYAHVHFYSNPEFYHKIIDLWMGKTMLISNDIDK